MNNITVKNIVEATGGILLCGDENTVIKNIALDSRQMRGDDIFVPIVGEKTDGHLYIESAFENGAVATFTSEHMSADDSHPWIHVGNTVAALQMLGVYLRSRLNMPFVAVTGSVGKTTTREIIATALGAGKKVTKTDGNANSQVGVPVTLSLLDESADVAVLELGISLPGEMQKLARLAKPNIAVVTNIGVSHIEFLKTKENIMAEKLHITDGFGPENTLIINNDDALLAPLKNKKSYKVISYGLGEGADFRAVDIKEDESGVSFDLVTNADFGMKKIPCKINTMGIHNALNALAALAVSFVSGVNLKDAAAALASFKPLGRRLETIPANGFTIIDDTYNASPDSMIAALRVLSNANCAGKKIAVLADILEVGEHSAKYHSEIGEVASTLKIDRVFTIGKSAKHIAEKTAMAGINSNSFMTNEEALAGILPEIGEGDVVLIKGSNAMHLEEIINALKEI